MRRPDPAPLVPAWKIVANALATFLVVFVAGLALIATVPRLLGYDSIVVSSGSMSPRIRTGDVVITSDVDDIELGPGTVIDFERDGETVLHRIVEVTPDGFVTSGDANAAVDSSLVATEDVRGVGIVRVPIAGWPALWVDRGEWLPLLVLLVGAATAGYVGRVAWLVPPDPADTPSPGDRGDDDATDALRRLHPYVTELVPPPIPENAREATVTSGDR